MRPSRRGAATAVLSRRSFRLLFSAQLVSGLGDGVSLVAVSFAVLRMTGSVHALGLVLVARFIPLSGLLLVAGVVADRLPRRRLLVAADLARAVAQAGLALLLATGGTRLWPLLVLQVVYGGAEAFASPALTALVPQIVSRAELQPANALMQMTYNMSRVLGPALGAILVLALGTGGAIAFDAASFAVSALLTSRVVAPRAPAAAGPRDRFRAELAAGWREVLARRWILVAVVNFTFFAAFTIPVVLVLGPALSWRGLGGVTGWAALTSAFGVGALVASIGAMHLQVRRPGLALMALLVVAALRPLSFVSGLSLPVVAAYCFLAGAAMSMASVVWYTLLQRHVPAEVLARVSAIDDFGTSLLTPVGYLCAAPVAAAIGLERCIVLLSAVPVALGLLSLAVPSIRRLGWPERPVSAPSVSAALAA